MKGLTTFTTAPVAQAVIIAASATDPAASVVVSGGTSLRVGDNAVSVLVTAENGATQAYRLNVRVPASNNTNIMSILINSVPTTTGSTVILPKGTRSVNVKVATQDILATTTISHTLS